MSCTRAREVVFVFVLPIVCARAHGPSRAQNAVLPPFRQLITYSGAAIATLPSHFRIHERVHAALAAAMSVYGQQQRAERVRRDQTARHAHPILRVCAEGPVLVRAPGDRALDCGDEKKPTSEAPVAKPESPRIALPLQAISTVL